MSGPPVSDPPVPGPPASPRGRGASASPPEPGASARGSAPAASGQPGPPRPPGPSGPPAQPPVGLYLARVAREASRAFDAALAAAGGSLPTWLVLISLKSQRLASQRELAGMVGIQEATLTHHLNAMESSGLVTRRRDTANRRVHVVELTPAGDELFMQLREAAVAFDQQLRAGLTATEIEQFEAVLSRLHENVSQAGHAGPA